ncbi:hypothetical protein [Nonomuraea basaltis]|uniref:hypothetical protein n=1 Tax=Nonomuraea basaltis TaxID=2495887 RepID=UPI00110C55BE|nr:hypothetical protein [Nonomuraea basaltis]TMR89125.1 hypothetical protein EJK15_62400 [Nonomuraea basaltis]
MTSIEVHGPVQAAGQNVRQVVAQAAVLQDWAGRQLSTLRNTYPAWQIEHEKDASGEVWWTARLLPTFTVDMAAAGVLQTVRQPDAIALAATLAWQTALLHNARSRTGPL